MKKTALVFLVLIILIVAGAVIYLAIQKSGNNQNSQQQGTNAVEIKNFAFVPQTLTVHAGDTVTWTNMDSVNHKIVSDTGSELSSELLSNGASYSHTFSAAGTYAYHCAIHSTMKGTIIVQ